MRSSYGDCVENFKSCNIFESIEFKSVAEKVAKRSQNDLLIINILFDLVNIRKTSATTELLTVCYTWKLL